MEEKKPDSKVGNLFELLSIESHYNTTLYSMLRRVADLGVPEEKMGKLYTAFEKAFDEMDKALQEMFGIPLPWGHQNSDLVPLIGDSKGPKKVIPKGEEDEHDMVVITTVSLAKSETFKWFVPKKSKNEDVMLWFQSAKKGGIFSPISPVKSNDHRSYTVIRIVEGTEQVLGML